MRTPPKDLSERRKKRIENALLYRARQLKKASALLKKRFLAEAEFHFRRVGEELGYTGEALEGYIRTKLTLMGEEELESWKEAKGI